MEKILIKIESKEVAESEAKRLSDGKTLFVIQSQGFFYVDESGFVRSSEKLISIWEDGKKQKLR